VHQPNFSFVYENCCGQQTKYVIPKLVVDVLFDVFLKNLKLVVAVLFGVFLKNLKLVVAVLFGVFFKSKIGGDFL
jgi:hypothetical protein